MLNSRMKDFYDIRLLSHAGALNEKNLVEALAATFTMRRTPVPAESVVFTDAFLEDASKQKQWASFLGKRQIQDAPQLFSEIAREVIGFLKPLLARAREKQNF